MASMSEDLRSRLLPEPPAGSRVARNGVEFTVQHVADGWVYGVAYRMPVDDGAVERALKQGERPPGCLGPRKISLRGWAAAMMDPDVRVLQVGQRTR